jgi:hypothetical protein
MGGRTRQILIFIGSVALAFLAGFLLEYSRANQWRQELGESRQQIEFCRVRDLAGMMFLQTSLKNYGMASRSATEFFEAAKALAASARSPQVRQKLQAALAGRDAITAQLARGDAAAYGPVQAIYQSLIEEAHSTAP